MSKLIQLPEGAWVQASNILVINKPYECDGLWCYNITIHGYYQSGLRYVYTHVVVLSPLIKEESKARERMNAFAKRVNEALG